jgi:Reverse transcriptase (RNA-dependent DNA polymerase)
MGVPPEWVSFLIQLDIEGTTSVRLPVSQFAHDKAGQAGPYHLQALGATDVLFPAERGVPQGYVASPFGWNAVYDLLLGALTIQRRHIMDPATQAIAYADDLLSVSSTNTSLQQQADLVAAFAAIFELDLAHTKFRAYEFPYHRTHARQPSTPPFILKVNKADIPLRQTGTLMYLGSQYDLDPKGQSQYDHHQLQLDRHLHAIRHRPALINSKIYVLQSALIPRLTYTSQMGTPNSPTHSYIPRCSSL